MRKHLSLLLALLLPFLVAGTLHAQENVLDIGDGFQAKSQLDTDGQRLILVHFPAKYIGSESVHIEGIKIALVKIFKCDAFKDCKVEFGAKGKLNGFNYVTVKTTLGVDIAVFPMLEGAKEDETEIVGIGIRLLLDAPKKTDLGDGFTYYSQYNDKRLFMLVEFPKEYLTGSQEDMDKGTMLAISKLFSCKEFRKAENGKCTIAFGGYGTLEGVNGQYKFIDTDTPPAFRIAIFGFNGEDGQRIGIAITLLEIPAVGLKT